MKECTLERNGKEGKWKMKGEKKRKRAKKKALGFSPKGKKRFFLASTFQKTKKK